MKKHLAGLAAIVLMAGVLPATAQYQASPPPSDQPAEPQPGVARVSFIHGDVSSQRGDNGDWVAVTLNAPISPDDRVATGEKSRAELQLDYADSLRMADSATVKVATLARTHIQLQVGQGLVSYSVLKGSEADSEIDTPNAAIHPQGPGQYRILVNSDAETEVTVRDGSADVSTPQGSTHVDRGEMVTVQGTDNPQYKTEAALGKDDWDSWNDERNHRIDSAESWRKTDRYYTGSEDLDDYGKWSEVPDYGPVWIPNSEGPDWAPYRDGRWVYEPYYGWTWVSYEPWGWAPYHYGRWFVYGGDWAWWPGPVVAYPAYYPVWSPAYVSFFGFGGGGFGFGFGAGFGSVGWLPVGPCDPFFPWFGGFGNSFTVININNFHDHDRFGDRDFHGIRPLAGDGFRGRRFSNFDEAVRNDRVRGGMSSMASKEFGRAAVSAHQQRISEASFRKASVMTGKMPVAPTRESFSPSGRSVNSSAFRNVPPRSQHFFTGGARTSVAANVPGSRSFGNTNGTARVPSGINVNRNGSPFARPTSPTPSRATGWNQPNGSTTAQSNRPGWHTFTPPNRTTSGTGSVAHGIAPNDRSSGTRPSRGTFAPPSQPSSTKAFQGNQPQNRNSWQHFTPPARGSQSQDSNRGFMQPSQSQREFHPPSSASRGSYPNSYSRPQLNMRQPIVTQRGGGYYGREPYTRAPSGGSAGPRGGYEAPRGGYSAPRGGGGYSAPRGGYSAPRGGGGGGGSRGGGGGHSNNHSR
ncbi:MAG TPA: DUF6600 domain-containing protein [Candidatus Acidoferrales bacterium]|nr:DUF6600 domain-containing protein [Candidatus Acidoferrales bacterium]